MLRNTHRKRILIVTDIHFCQLIYGGIPRDEKAELLIRQINREYEKDPFEFILFLGDYSLDHWAWNTKGTWLVQGKSYTRELVCRFFHRLPTPYYMLAGNHEQYGNEKWRELTGCERSMSIVLEDNLFILWDSYGADLDPTEHSDGTYTPPKVEEIRAIMDAHPDKRVFLCSHWFVPTGSEEERRLICDERVVCLFVGHSHKSSVITLPEEYGSKPMIQAGAWVAGSPQDATPWGVRDLVIDGENAVTSYLVPEHDGVYNGEKYHVDACRRDSAVLRL